MKKTLVILALLGIFIASTWSLFNSGFFKIHDFLHSARVAEMARAIQDGHFPPRWSANFGYGYGMPLFQFYGPFPYYVGAIFYFLGISAVDVVKLLYILVTAFGFWGAYKLGSYLYSSWSGVLVAAAFTLAPYRAVNLYIRGALNETVGLTALLWVLYGSLLVLDKKPQGKLVLIFSLVILFLSHNITTMIAIPFCLGWTLAMGLIRNKKDHWKTFLKNFIQVIKAYIWAIAISAFYLFPAFLEKDLTQVTDLITTKYFQYHLHFLYIRQFFDSVWGYGGSEWGPDDKMSFFLGWGQWLAIVMGILTLGKWLLRFIRSKKISTVGLKYGPEIIIQLLLIGFALFLAIYKSEWLWSKIPLLDFVQFPWRFLGIGIVFISVMVATVFQTIGLAWKPLAFLIFGMTLLANTIYFKPEGYLDETKGLYFYESDRITDELSGALPDYIPQAISEEIWRTPSTGHILVCQADQSCPFISEVIVDKSHQKLISIESLSSGKNQVELEIASYPGWEVEIDGNVVSQTISEKGLIKVELDTSEIGEGQHLIGARFGYTKIRLISDVVSGLAILGLLASASLKKFKVLNS